MTKRTDEFVNYHITGDGECNSIVLAEWANAHNLTAQERYELAYFFAITYCVGSAIYIFLNKKDVGKAPRAWAEQNKDKIIFQSDRKYIRMKDSFARCLLAFADYCDVDDFLKKVKTGDKLDFAKAIPYVSSWVLFGRFSAFLFLEMFIYLYPMEFTEVSIEWKKGNTATSGLLNVFGLDKEADMFDKTGKLWRDTNQLDFMLSALKIQIAAEHGNTNVTTIETSLCAYRKFFKQSRYNGFYLDRMLEEIHAMEKDHAQICAELCQIRARCFQPKYLGELGGWRGVRKEMKKSYMQTGMII